jgi:CheY-like chemotaxis protein/HPt (histidine-containing phosphotransfer) domain-containing protein
VPLFFWSTIVQRSEVTSQANQLGTPHLVEPAAVLIKPLRPATLHRALISRFSGAPDMLEPLPEAGQKLNHQMGKTHPLHIMLAEDNVVNQKFALWLLGKLGYRADVVSNGMDVIYALKRQWYDVILMDVKMPEMDGIETTRYIRKFWPAAHRPHIIAMTAYAMQGHREWLIKAGMDDYVSKPVQLDALVRALEQVAGKPQPAPDTATPTERAPAPAPVEYQYALASAFTDDSESPPLVATVIEGFLKMAGPKVAGEFFTVYSDNALKLLNELWQALNTSDVEHFTRTAHTLKSNSAQLGALHLSLLCKKLESIGQAGSFEGAADLVLQAETEFDRVQGALMALQHALQHEGEAKRVGESA